MYTPYKYNNNILLIDLCIDRISQHLSFIYLFIVYCL